MSRFSFESMVTNALVLVDAGNNMEDLKGCWLSDWIDFGGVGWDDMIESYFLQLDTGEDEPIWWFGTRPKEVPTFGALCDLIKRIFQMQSNVFNFQWPEEKKPKAATDTYVGYFFNEEGQYQSRMYLQSMYKALLLAFTYRKIVPKIMITESDESILTIENGQLVHLAQSSLGAQDINELSLVFQPITEFSFDQTLEHYEQACHSVESECSMANKMMLLKIEYHLMAIAANQGINLYSYGYRPAEVLITEIEEGAF